MSVTRINVERSNSSVIKEHWTSESKTEIIELFESIEVNFPESEYGTRLSNVKQDPTMLLWHADFTRYSNSQ